MIRCNWANNNLLLSNYHDNEWGIPLYDDQLLFESLTLELFQSGLSWLTILQKRDHFRKAFDYFNIDSISNYDQIDVDRLLSNSNVVRHRLKIESTINNAQKTILIQNEYGSFNNYLWSSFHNDSILYDSIILSEDLLKRGFRFLGQITCHSFMQSVGLINGHSNDCYLFD